MNRQLVILVLLILSGCDTITTPAVTPTSKSAVIPGNGSIIDQWARALEAGKFDEAKTMTTIKSLYWEESTRIALNKASWKPHRVLELPADEKPYAPEGVVRIQWELDLATSERYRIVCTDVRENDGKVEAFNKTQYCTSDGVFEQDQPTP